MQSAELFVSVATANRLFVLVVYLAAGLTCYWWLYPRLLPTAQWLASGMLAAQVLVIMLSLEVRPYSFFESWHWYLDQERNIPSTLASTQLAVVAVVALVTAVLVRRRSAWHGLYLSGTGLLFLYIALDDYFNLRSFIPNWQLSYLILGATLVVATLILAARSCRRTGIWSICLLTGLALVATGGLVFVNLPNACGNLGFLRIDGCLRFKAILDEILEFAGGWLTLVAILGHFSDAVPTARPRAQLALFAIPVLWVVLLVYSSPFVSNEIGPASQRGSAQFESGVYLHGHRIKPLDGSLLVSLYAATPWRRHLGLGYSIHLVDQVSRGSVSSRDDDWCCHYGLQSYVPMYEQSMKVAIPSETPVNRALWVVLTVWRRQGGGFIRQAVVESDYNMLNETQIVLGELVIPEMTSDVAATPVAAFDNGFMLDRVELPAAVHAGDTVNIRFVWRSNVAGDEDLAQFLHFAQAESGTWWGYDQQPLGARLPTRLWYAGLADSETWQVPLGDDLAPGQYSVLTGLYRTSDLVRIPAYDADGLPFPDASVLLGSLRID